MKEKQLTKEDVENIAKKVLEKNGLATECPKCGESLVMTLFWFDCGGRSYRICPNCSKRVYGGIQ